VIITTDVSDPDLGMDQLGIRLVNRSPSSLAPNVRR